MVYYWATYKHTYINEKANGALTCPSYIWREKLPYVCVPYTYVIGMAWLYICFLNNFILVNLSLQISEGNRAGPDDVCIFFSIILWHHYLKFRKTFVIAYYRL